MWLLLDRAGEIPSQWHGCVDHLGRFLGFERIRGNCTRQIVRDKPAYHMPRSKWLSFSVLEPLKFPFHFKLIIYCLLQVALLRMPNERPVTAVAVSEDGSGLVSAGFDGVLHLWVLGEECGGGLGTTLRSGQQWQRRLAQPTGAGEVIYTCSMTLAVWSWLGVG